MKIQVVTLFPEVFKDFFKTSIIGRAQAKKLVELEAILLRDFAKDKHRKCDDYPYGGGPGMVLKPEPIIECFTKLQAKGKRVIYPSASGRLYHQGYASDLAREKEFIILCGHYEGLDQRIIDYYVTDEISIGDYILSGGEVAAMVIIETVVRLLEGAINAESHEFESLKDGLLEYPQYTRPRIVLDMSVPEVLLNGNHAEIQRWRMQKSIAKTALYRPELLERAKQKQELRLLIEEYYQREAKYGFNQGT